MPIIEFTGVEASHETLMELISEIKKWVASVKSLGVFPDVVTPMFRPTVQENPGEQVVFYVQELFTISFSGIVRSVDVRRKLHRSLAENFASFVKTGKLKVKPKSVTIVIRMVDRDNEEYHHFNIEEE